MFFFHFSVDTIKHHQIRVSFNSLMRKINKIFSRERCVGRRAPSRETVMNYNRNSIRPYATINASGDTRGAVYIHKQWATRCFIVGSIRLFAGGFLNRINDRRRPKFTCSGASGRRATQNNKNGRFDLLFLPKFASARPELYRNGRKPM